MQIDLSHNAAEIAALLQQRAAQAPQLARKGVIDGTTVLFEKSRSLLSQLIYNRAIPEVERRSRATGRLRKVKLWKRTSNLIRGEKQHLKTEANRVTGTVDNSTPYALARHNLNRPTKSGYDNHAPWRQMAVQQAGANARAAFMDALRAMQN